MKFNQLLPELSVTDLQASLEFYKTIGFKIEYERPEDKFAFISFEDVQFMLQEIRKPEDSKDDKWNVGELKYPFGNGINFEIDINRQISTIYDKIRQAGYKIAFDIEENWYREDDKLHGNKEFLVQDPDGYLLRFSEDLGEIYLEYIVENCRIIVKNVEKEIVAEIDFEKINDDTYNISRTFVDESLRGKGIANELVTKAYKEITVNRKAKVVASCSYASKWLEKNKM